MDSEELVSFGVGLGIAFAAIDLSSTFLFGGLSSTFLFGLAAHFAVVPHVVFDWALVLPLGVSSGRLRFRPRFS